MYLRKSDRDRPRTWKSDRRTRSPGLEARALLMGGGDARAFGLIRVLPEECYGPWGGSQFVYMCSSKSTPFHRHHQQKPLPRASVSRKFYRCARCFTVFIGMAFICGYLSGQRTIWLLLLWCVCWAYRWHMSVYCTYKCSRSADSKTHPRRTLGQCLPATKCNQAITYSDHHLSQTI